MTIAQWIQDNGYNANGKVKDNDNIATQEFSDAFVTDNSNFVCGNNVVRVFFNQHANRDSRFTPALVVDRDMHSDYRLVWSS
jgi:hypothetical protein